MALSTRALTPLLPQSSDPSELRRCVNGLVMAADRSVQTHGATAQRVTSLEAAVVDMKAKQEETLKLVRGLVASRATDQAVGKRTWAILIGGLTAIQILVGVALKVLL
jgi:hypothetical protein